MSAPVRR